MTDPVPDLISIGTQEMADTAKRLGLTWTLRPALVVVAKPLTIVYDGDIGQVPIGAESLIGYLGVGARVMVMFVPPSGNFIIGNTTVGDLMRPTWLEYAVATADTNLSTVEAVIPGLLFTIKTTTQQTRWEAEGTFGWEETAVGSTTAIGRLYVDGVLQAATALLSLTFGGQRATTGQTWAGNFTTAGTHTFQARVARSANAGTQNANQTNTTLKVKVYE